MSKNVYMTGIGLVGPHGNNSQTFWDAMMKGESAIEIIEELDPGNFNVRLGGIVKDIEPEKYFHKRLLKKCSRFSVLSLLACHEAIADADLNLDVIDKNRIGIFVGNNSGGWESAREGLEILHTEGPQFVSPFLASNWFPAAPQGHISLAFGIRGFSKTVISDKVSGLLAISYAAKAIRKGVIDIAIVGGVETPLDKWALPFYESSGILCADNSCVKKAYRPFDENRKGMVLAEGAAFMIIESEDSVRERRGEKKVKCSIQGYGMTFDGKEDAETEVCTSQCARAIAMALKSSDAAGSDIDYLSMAGTAISKEDHIECEAVNRVFGDEAMGKPAGCPKASFGNTIGAAGAFDVALAAMSMKNSIIPKVANLEGQDKNCRLNFVKNNFLEKDIKAALIVSRGFGGASSAMIIKNENL